MMCTIKIPQTACRMKKMCPLGIENNALESSSYTESVSHHVSPNFAQPRWPLPINNRPNFLVLLFSMQATFIATQNNLNQVAANMGASKPVSTIGCPVKRPPRTLGIDEYLNVELQMSFE